MLFRARICPKPVQWKRNTCQLDKGKKNNQTAQTQMWEREFPSMTTTPKKLSAKKATLSPEDQAIIIKARREVSFPHSS